MNEFDFEVTLFVGKSEFSTNKAPTLDQARKVCLWHNKKDIINSANIRTLSTGALEMYRSDGESVIELGTGSILDECPGCQEKDMVITELQKTIKGEKLKNAALRREKEDDIKDGAFYEDAMECFAFWKLVCKHPRSEMDLDRYKDIVPFLRNPNYGKELCLRAIAGAAHKPTNTNMRGDEKIFNDWNLIFRNNTKFENFCNRAPAKWKEIYGVNSKTIYD